MSEQAYCYKAAYEREKKARRIAEQLLEEKTLGLYLSNLDLEKNNRELRENQQALIQSEKMASIGILAAGVAHEINNPVGYSLSNVGVLADCLDSIFQELKNPDKELQYLLGDVNELLSETTEGLERVAEIVKDLQGFARKSDEAVKPSDINSAIRSTLNILSNEIKYTCQVSFNEGDLPPVYCNIAKIHQVLLNIVLNAAQSIEGEGTIAISTSRVGEFVLISITDTGCGISENNLAKVFTPFFTTKEVGEGTGLGLSVCYSIVKEHGGDIHVSSRPGEGTCFDISLPIGG